MKDRNKRIYFGDNWYTTICTYDNSDNDLVVHDHLPGMKVTEYKKGTNIVCCRHCGAVAPEEALKIARVMAKLEAL